jgi:hypothetical protein
LASDLEQLEEARVAHAVVDTRSLTAALEQPLLAESAQVLGGPARVETELTLEVADRLRTRTGWPRMRKKSALRTYIGWSNGIWSPRLRRSGGSRSVGTKRGRPAAAPVPADSSLPDRRAECVSQRLGPRRRPNGRSDEAERKLLSRNARTVHGLRRRPFAASDAVAPI